jgi:MinD superfamily P-loop ATPase
VKSFAILSGKGGTGKTTFAAACGFLAGESAILCDCDVDAANLHLVSAARGISAREFSGGSAALIDQGKCSSCGKCMEVCHFDAVQRNRDSFVIDATRCEGCGYCLQVCPAEAVSMVEQKSGDIYVSESRFGSVVVHAELGTGAENSGKLSTKVRQIALGEAQVNGKSLIIIDGPPGVSCPAIAAASGTDYLVVVTEPSVSGFSDLRRVLELSRKLGIRTGVLINKADINPGLTLEIKQAMALGGFDLLGELPWDRAFVKALRCGKTIAETAPESLLTAAINGCWLKINAILEATK